MRSIAPRHQDQASRQEKHRAAGLVLLLTAVVAGVVLQIALVPRQAQAVHSTRLASPEAQVAAFGPPAPMAPRASHDFLQPRPRPGRRQTPARSRLGLAQPNRVRSSSPSAVVEPGPSRSSRPAYIARPAGSQRSQPAGPQAPSAANPMPGHLVEAAIVGVDPAQGSDDGANAVQAGEPDEREASAGLTPPTPAPAAGHAAQGEPRVPGARDQGQGEARMSVLGPADAREGDLVTFAVSVDGVREIAHTPVRLTYDPQVLEFVEAEEGTMLASDGAPTRFQVGHGGGEGVIDVLVSRTQPGGGLTGSGVLFTVTFLAHAPGETPILTAGSSLLDASGRRMRFQSEEIALSVRP